MTNGPTPTPDNSLRDGDLVPSPYGLYSAQDGSYSVAGPLLAGFSLTLIVLVLQLPEGSSIWPDIVLFAFALSACCELLAIQFGFWMRAYTVSRRDALDWWGDGEDVTRQGEVRRERMRHLLVRDVWARRARRSYELGVVSLLAGLTLLLIPASPLGMSYLRYCAAAIPFLALLFELAWAMASELDYRAATKGRKGRLLALSRRVFPS